MEGARPLIKDSVSTHPLLMVLRCVVPLREGDEVSFQNAKHQYQVHSSHELHVQEWVWLYKIRVWFARSLPVYSNQ